MIWQIQLEYAKTTLLTVFQLSLTMTMTVLTALWGYSSKHCNILPNQELWFLVGYVRVYHYMSGIEVSELITCQSVLDQVYLFGVSFWQQLTCKFTIEQVFYLNTSWNQIVCRDSTRNYEALS